MDERLETLCLSAFLRREGDSIPRNAFDVYTLSRRASSATRASLLYVCEADFKCGSKKLASAKSPAKVKRKGDTTKRFDEFFQKTIQTDTYRHHISASVQRQFCSSRYHFEYST